MQKSYITDTNKIRLFAKILLLRLGRLCHCGIVLDTVISVKQLLRMNQKCWYYHIFPRILHRSQKYLSWHRVFYLRLNKSNKIHHLILYFPSHLQNREVNELYSMYIVALFFYNSISRISILMCLFKNRLVYIKYRLKNSKINPHLNLELILHTRLFQTGKMHIFFYKTN